MNRPIARGAPGLAIGSSVGVTAYVVLLAWRLKKDIGDRAGLGEFLLRVLPAVVVAIVLGLALKPSLGTPAWTRTDAIFRTVALGGVSGCAFVAASWAFGVGEVREVGARVLRRFGR